MVKKVHGSDPFVEFYPHLDTTIQIKHAEEINLGTSQYELIEI